MRSLTRLLQRAIVVLANLDPRLRLRAALLVLLFSLALNLFSNALYDLLVGWWWWLALGVPILLILVSLAVLALNERMQPATAPRTGAKPATFPGLILMLGIYRSEIKDEIPPVWTFKELQHALSQPDVDWTMVRRRIETSNLQPALEAIRYHSHDRTLQQLWLLSTKDLVDAVNADGTEKVKQPGSCHLAPLFARSLREAFAYDFSIYYDNPKLSVSPYDVTEIYHAVESIFEEEAPVAGLSSDQVIADLTGGRVTLTTGMVLACAPRGWAMQYTSTDHDPATGGPAKHLIPLRIDVNVQDILRRALEARRQQLDD